jgi:hypothetical protein
MESEMKDAVKTFCAGLIVLIGFSLIVIQPRLIGYGCDGKSNPMFAKYESDFPACERIEPIF